MNDWTVDRVEFFDPTATPWAFDPGHDPDQILGRAHCTMSDGRKFISSIWFTREAWQGQPSICEKLLRDSAHPPEPGAPMPEDRGI